MAEAQTPREFFERILPRRFKPDKAVGVDVTVQVDIAGPNGGSWTVTIKNQKIGLKREHMLRLRYLSQWKKKITWTWLTGK
ncbi:MAG: hypothetical protein QXX34_02700 [Candidatus Bathyarchaeia archaeon]